MLNSFVPFKSSYLPHLNLFMDSSLCIKKNPINGIFFLVGAQNCPYVASENLFILVT